MKTTDNQICSKCVLDRQNDPYITFDDQGVCNHCREYDTLVSERLLSPTDSKKKLNAMIDAIKAAGKGKEYDCLIGLSGGVDSTYLAYKVKEFGLRPLAVHFDNGWNDELAVKNIENIVNKLDIPLYTLVVDWNEFRDLQLSYLKASVVDIEAITDHAILATMYRLAMKHSIKYILSGTNIVTEAILPSSWVHNKGDSINIRAIHDAYGQVKLKTYPTIDLKKLQFAKIVYGIKSEHPLDYMPYVKSEVKKVIMQELDWRDYGGKHYESIFTRFYQGHILLHKFGIDKRRAHLSNLICSGQMSREQAIQELQLPAYDPKQEAIDKTFVLKKLGLSSEEFDKIMQLPRREHSEFQTGQTTVYDFYPWLKPARPIVRLVKKMAGWL